MTEQEKAFDDYFFRRNCITEQFKPDYRNGTTYKIELIQWKDAQKPLLEENEKLKAACGLLIEDTKCYGAPTHTLNQREVKEIEKILNAWYAFVPCTVQKGDIE